MENFFKIPSSEFLAQLIYIRVVEAYESGHKCYYYKLPYGLSTSVIADIVDRLGERLLDIEVIDHNNKYIIVDWS